MAFKWRKWVRVTHRDLGYLFFGMTLVYAISGVAINHLNDWNPNYKVTREMVTLNLPADPQREDIINALGNIGRKEEYKQHIFPDEGYIKIFIRNGSIETNLETGKGILETIEKRPVFRALNYLHYNPVKWWTYFSDLYSVSLVIIAATGLFILKGKTGITGRGAWLTILGIIIPLIFLFIYYR